MSVIRVSRIFLVPLFQGNAKRGNHFLQADFVTNPPKLFDGKRLCETGAMTAPRPYALEEMLPFARAALKNYERLRADFTTEDFAEGLSSELVKVGVEGVVRGGFPGSARTKFNYGGNYPDGLKRSVSAVLWCLIHRGFILPQWREFPSVAVGTQYWMTERGRQWANGAEPMPEDVAGYVGHLDALVPKLDPIIRQYVAEGLGSFHREHYFSAAIMLGAASEKEIYLLGASMVPALHGAQHKKDLPALLGNRSLYKLLTFIGERLRGVSSTVRKSSNGLFDGAETHLASLFESIRVQRNDAVHPSTGAVNERSVRMAYDSFPAAVLKAEELREWCGRNPNTL